MEFKDKKELIILTSKEILLGLMDFNATLWKNFGSYTEKKAAKVYWDWREIDRNNYYKKLWQLEKNGFIKRYKESDKTTVQLTEKGQNKVLTGICREYQIEIPDKWDKKWHLVIFDIPEEKKVARNILRSKIKNIGFIQLQKSVFVFPFDSQEIVNNIKLIYSIEKYVQYAVVDSIDSGLNLIDIFISKGILSEKSR